MTNKAEHAAPTQYCGTLSYTRRGLVALFDWMLWGDFCYTMMEAVVPSILPLKLRSLESPNVEGNPFGEYEFKLVEYRAGTDSDQR